MDPSWTIIDDRVSGDPDPVSFSGEHGKPFTLKVKKEYQDKLTRHHVINIQVLQSAWNQAVASQDADTFRALGKWCAFPDDAVERLVTTPTINPIEFQRQVCWNPFNIIVGPSTTVRVGDPGSGFDKIQFTTLPKFDGFDDPGFNESLARQEFNQHIERLTRINMYLTRYITGELYEQEIGNLRTLLKSDRPSLYPNLFKALTAKVDKVKDRNYNQEADALIVSKMKGKTTKEGQPLDLPKFSPDRLPGAITHPALWYNVFAMPDLGLQTSSDVEVWKGRLVDKVVPWVSESYLPEPLVKEPIRPSQKHKDLFEVAMGLPTRSPAAVIDINNVTSDPSFSAKFAEAVENQGKIATQSGLRVFVIGPNYSEIFKNVLDRVTLEVLDLIKKGKRLRINSVPNRTEVTKVEVRLYYY